MLLNSYLATIEDDWPGGFNNTEPVCHRNTTTHCKGHRKIFARNLSEARNPLDHENTDAHAAHAPLTNGYTNSDATVAVKKDAPTRVLRQEWSIRFRINLYPGVAPSGDHDSIRTQQAAVPRQISEFGAKGGLDERERGWGN